MNFEDVAKKDFNYKNFQEVF